METRGPHWAACCALLLLAWAEARSGSGHFRKCDPPKVPCPETLKFRPIDGTCNNVRAPSMGAANTALKRLVRPDYSNGTLFAPRLSHQGGPLPSAQVLATALMPEVDHQYATSHLFPMWGQLISHDFSLIAAGASKATGPCCEKDAGDRCFPIPVPKDDPFYSQFNVRCLPMSRTNTTTQCTGGQPEQISLVTHLLDASFVYGSDEAKTKSLRTSYGGQLRVRNVTDSVGHVEEFPPNAVNPLASCGFDPCYLTGDVRVNQNPMLAGIQTLWIREHNRVARILATLNSHWDDERVFQETRRVIIAQWQIITYRDWLRYLLGARRAHELDLIPDGPENHHGYQPDEDCRTANDVTTGSFRALHSMIQGIFWLGRRGQQTEALQNWFGNPGPVLEKDLGLLDTLQGLVNQQSQSQDRWMDNQITQQLQPIKDKNGKSWGSNLAAVDIQRGRDHGIPGYVVYRKYVGLPEARDFDDLRGSFAEEDIDALKQLYGHVNDIDYYVGGLLERKEKGAPLFGPTFQKLLEDQFWRWRYADRFFYNFVGFDHSFSKDQIRSLERTSVGMLLCLNVKGFTSVPEDAFVKIGYGYEGNMNVPCDKVRSIDFKFWKETSNPRKRQH